MANTRAIEGKDVLLRAKNADDVLIPFACSMNIDFTYDRELITSTTVSSGSWRVYAYRMQEWGFSLSMVTFVKPKTTMYTVFDIMELVKGGQPIEIELSFIDAEGNARTITGKVLVPSIAITAPVEGFCEDTVEFKGTGPFEILTEVITTDPGTDPEDVVRDGVRTFNYDTVGEESVITNAQLAGKQIISVSVDGQGRKIITAGSPNDKQVKYISDGGSLVFSYALPPQTWVLVLYT